MTDTRVADLGKGNRFVLLTTYRRDGTPVSTAMWAAPDGDDLVFWTPADTWKVKRLRRDPAVRVQACDRPGRNTFGPELAGVGEIVDADTVASLLARKYGIVGALMIRGSRLFHPRVGSVGIRVRDAA
ncbi:MAG: PPOX class F420-dependent oxidoreductase [Gordonia sp. (in: high G+C Gram-positive bacteria)]|uniref:PPOX class F420-dependent oxidoreductase n=1 Tax=Gordonia sp. (in: high G+C Gram-positive bacteria) TaxID=84139 RepID=UPI0039E49BBC